MIALAIVAVVIAIAIASFVAGRRRRTLPPTAVGGRGGVPEIQEARASERRRRVLVLTVCMVVVFLFPLVAYQPAEAALSDTMRGIFSGALRDFVNGILADSSNNIYIWAWMIFLAFSVILIFLEVVKFIFDGVDPLSHFEALAYFFITLALMGSYDGFTEAVWGVGTGIANGYQEYLVGNTDNFFLVQWTRKALGAVVLEELSIFDAIRVVLYGFSWFLLTGILEIVLWLAAMWAEFGYALAKVVGMVFIPFLLLPATRPLFDAWFKFFCGFVVLTIILKATSVVVAIAIKATLEGLGVRFDGDYGDPNTIVNFAKDQLYMLSDINAIIVISVLFVLSSFGFAGMLAGGVGNLSGGLGKAANTVARKLIKKF